MRTITWFSTGQCSRGESPKAENLISQLWVAFCIWPLGPFLSSIGLVEIITSILSCHFFSKSLLETISMISASLLPRFSLPFLSVFLGACVYRFAMSSCWSHYLYHYVSNSFVIITVFKTASLGCIILDISFSCSSVFLLVCSMFSVQSLSVNLPLVSVLVRISITMKRHLDYCNSNRAKHLIAVADSSEI